MKSNKDRVLEFIKEYTKENDYVTAYLVSMHLSMQRSNVSSILNQLAKEGLITKGNGRPVKFFIESKKSNDFESLIGSEGSLLEAIQIIKAAVLYPSYNHLLLFNQDNGCEGSVLSELTYQFAKQAHVLVPDAKYYVFDCDSYQDQNAMINDLVNNQGYLFKSQNGMLLIKNAQLLNVEQRSMLFNVLDQEKIKVFIVFLINNDDHNEAYNSFRKKINFTINIPSLKERPLKERYQYVEQHLINEANNINKSIKLNAGLIQCLLVYSCLGELKQLEKDIQIGCANAYARSHNQENNSIELTILDFPNYVRKGIVNIKENQEELNQIVNDQYLYSFTQKEVLRSRNNHVKQEEDIYSMIQNKKEELNKKNLSSAEINAIISMDIMQDFKSYISDVTSDINSLDDLKVSNKLIMLVEEFLDDMSDTFKKSYSIKLKYAMCIFINNALNNHSQVIQNEVVMDIINNYDEQYIYAKRFVKKLETNFNVKLGIDENVLITLFIIQEDQNTNKIVTLLVMHGNAGAKSISEVVRELTNNDNIYGLDLPLDYSYEQSYQALKNKLIAINQGLGVIVIYDMGSIKTLSINVAKEINIPLKCIECPITLLAVSSVKQSLYQNNIDDIYNALVNDERSLPKPESLDSEVSELFEYMTQQFDNLTVEELNTYVSPIIDYLKQAYPYINDDSMIGIIIHIICLIDGLLKHQSPSTNINAAHIIGHYPEDINQLRILFKDVEHHFNIIINDSELATIISIILNNK